ncbi:MAG: hypothetical protein NUV82_04515 [Candidatus Komeilibacteria bacterium]|nr:hypothetical protein [Candidatus Komeilibacteria bacterium]
MTTTSLAETISNNIGVGFSFILLPSGDAHVLDKYKNRVYQQKLSPKSFEIIVKEIVDKRQFLAVRVQVDIPAYIFCQREF